VYRGLTDRLTFNPNTQSSITVYQNSQRLCCQNFQFQTKICFKITLNLYCYHVKRKQLWCTHKIRNKFYATHFGSTQFCRQHANSYCCAETVGIKDLLCVRQLISRLFHGIFFNCRDFLQRHEIETLMKDELW
jgi:hypothetical protein